MTDISREAVERLIERAERCDDPAMSMTLRALLDAAEARFVVKPLVWERDWPSCFTVQSLKASDNGCNVVFYGERSDHGRYKIDCVTKRGTFYCRSGNGEKYLTLELAQAAAQADYEARILSAITLTTPSDKAVDALSSTIAEAAGLVFAVVASEYDGATPNNICGKWAWGRVRALAGKGE